MAGKHIWKLLLVVFIVGFSVYYLIPLQDSDFEDYLRQRSDSEEFIAILDRAVERQQNDPSIASVYMALKVVAEEERIDLTQYFPEVNIERKLQNIDKRNKILLNELLSNSKAKLRRGLDIEGGVSATMQIDPGYLQQFEPGEREETLSKAIEIIQDRIDSYGVSEPVVRAVGENRIEVQIAGVSTKDNPEIIEILKKPARLDFREVHLTATPGAGPPPTGYEEMTLVHDSGERSYEERLYVKRIPALTGKFVERADPRQNNVGAWSVSLSFNDEGKEYFADITEKLAGRGRLAIVLDGVLVSAPSVNEPIRGGNAEITGNFSYREAEELANVLNNPLDVPLEIAELYEVGPSLAADSIQSGLRAAAIGASLVAVFMLIYYMVGGLVALISVVANVCIVLGLLASFGATLTLPGIAGIILTVGMAVDANILIFERIREELRAGKTLKTALSGAFEKVFSTIFDANVTTLVVSLVMYAFGTGPVKGFGLTLAIGVGSTVFTALILSRVLLELLIETNVMKRFVTLSIINKPNFNPLKYKGPAFAVSWTIVLIGVIATAVKWDDIFGIEFTGGDEVLISFEERIDTSAIEEVAQNQGLGEVLPVYIEPLGGGPETLKIQTTFQMGKDVVEALQQAFPQAGLELIGENQIGPSIGDEIKSNAIWSIVISLGAILLYIALRFEIGYGIGAIVATVHDVLLTVGIFVLFDHQFTAPMISAILLIVGYSLNDTIVVFDRIREELALRPTAKLREIITTAINAVIIRSMLTSFTTLLAAGSLLVFGTGVINDIAFTFTIGIITGTLSSIFIASPVFFWWHRGDRRSVESSHDVAPEYEWQASSKASE